MTDAVIVSAVRTPVGKAPAGSLRSTRPDELVRTIGMDITDPGFWDAGLKILDGMVTEVERLAADS